MHILYLFFDLSPLLKTLSQNLLQIGILHIYRIIINYNTILFLFRYVNAIYGRDRPKLQCENTEFNFCLYKIPRKFLHDIIGMKDDQFWNDIASLAVILFVLRIVGFYLLRWKLMASRYDFEKKSCQINVLRTHIR